VQQALDILHTPVLQRFQYGETRLCGQSDVDAIVALADLLEAAVAALNTLQSNFSIVDAIRKSGRGMNKQAIPEMIEWCRKTGYEVCGFQRSATRT
jgi:hypothetical protein